MNLTVFGREGAGCPKQEKILTGEHTTLHRHAAAVHSVCIPLIIFIENISHITVIEPLQKVVQCEQFRLYAAQGYEEAQMC